MAHGFGGNIFTELHCVNPDTILRGMIRIRQSVRIFARIDGNYSKDNYQHCNTSALSCVEIYVFSVGTSPA
jgi:hypothetical protein